MNKWLSIWLIPFWVGLNGSALAQSLANPTKAPFSSDLSFPIWLIDNKEYSDAVYVLQEMRSDESLPPHRLDSLHFILAKAWYLQERIDSSNKYFSLLPTNSKLFTNAVLFYSFGEMYKRNYKAAEKQLLSLTKENGSSSEFIRFMLASNALMQKDFAQYEKISSGFTYSEPSCEWEQKQLEVRAREQRQNRRKSPLIAGLMSAIIPGSGKYYAGYRGQAISTLIPCLVFGAAGVESYFRAGPKSFSFITSSCLFGLFYLGNVWGSTLSVKTMYEQRDREIRHRLLLDVQIPMHRLFGQ